MAGADQGGRPADGVVEDYGAESAVGEGADFFPGAVFGYVAHFAEEAYYEIVAALIG